VNKQCFRGFTHANKEIPDGRHFGSLHGCTDCRCNQRLHVSRLRDNVQGYGGAGSALPQDTLSVFNNPAGLVRLGKRYDAELELFSPEREYKANNDFAPPPNPSVPPGREESENDYFLIPGFGINLPLDDRSTIGIALAGQGGMNTEYDTRHLC